MAPRWLVGLAPFCAGGDGRKPFGYICRSVTSQRPRRSAEMEYPQFVWYWPMRDPQNISRATTISSLEGPGRCRFVVFQFCAWIKILISGYRLVTFQSLWNWRRRQFPDNLPFGPVRDDRHPGKGSKQCTVSLLCFGCRFGFGPSDLNRFKNFRRHSQRNDHVYGECAGVQRFKIWTSWSKVTFDPLCAT